MTLPLYELTDIDSYLDGQQGQQRYRVLGDKPIGRGNYGIVIRARNSVTKEVVAIKCIARGVTVDEKVKREAINLASVDHPYLVRFREVFLTKFYLAIVMDFVAGWNLHDYIYRTPARHLSEQEALKFFQQLIIVVDFCHQKRITCRDVKLENVLVCSDLNSIQLIDFGYSKNVENSEPKSFVGTLTYVAPEVLQASSRERKTYSGQAADIWSCGVVLYAMLFGRYPFNRDTDGVDLRSQMKVAQRIFNLEYSFPTDIPVSSECMDLLEKIFVEDSKRVDMAGVKRHPWFQQLQCCTMQRITDNRVDRDPFSLPKRQQIKDIEGIIERAESEDTSSSEASFDSDRTAVSFNDVERYPSFQTPGTQGTPPFCM